MLLQNFTFAEVVLFLSGQSEQEQENDTVLNLQLSEGATATPATNQATQSSQEDSPQATQSSQEDSPQPGTSTGGITVPTGRGRGRGTRGRRGSRRGGTTRTVSQRGDDETEDSENEFIPSQRQRSLRVRKSKKRARLGYD